MSLREDHGLVVEEELRLHDRGSDGDVEDRDPGVGRGFVGTHRVQPSVRGERARSRRGASDPPHGGFCRQKPLLGAPQSETDLSIDTQFKDGAFESFAEGVRARMLEQPEQRLPRRFSDGGYATNPSAEVVLRFAEERV